MVFLLWTALLFLRIRYTKCTNSWHDLGEFFFATLSLMVQGMILIFSVLD